ncbi:MAG: A/G-specific adenine glycosylase [Ruthenibacterium sp.]
MQDFSIAAPLLAWFDKSKRVLPFRTISTPYRVWVSEIMLQQTRVSAALPYFERFMAALPTIADLAACEPEQLQKLWEGLGYYSRVRNLQKAAQIVLRDYGGELPADFDALQTLPGIGTYTAGAIASICFDLPVVAVDGNVLRVFARLLNCTGNVLHPDVKKELSAAVQEAQPIARCGDYNEALMELGALVCVPNTAPLCDACPLSALCRARKAGVQSTLPHKTPLRPRKQLDYTVALVLQHDTVLLQQRPQSGLLAGLWQPLLLTGTLSADETVTELEKLGILCTVRTAAPAAKHIFTHLEWRMTGHLCDAARFILPNGFVFASQRDIENVYTIPNAFKVYKKELEKLL